MRMRSIKWKLIIMYLGLVLIVMIVSGTYILLSVEELHGDDLPDQCFSLFHRDDLLSAVKGPQFIC